MSIVSNISDGATGRIFIAPNNAQPEGQSEIWFNLGPFMRSSPLSESSKPKYPALLQAASVSQAQYDSLLADIQRCVDAKSLPYWYAWCSCCTLCCGIGCLGCLHIKVVQVQIVEACKKVVEQNGAFELKVVEPSASQANYSQDPNSFAFDLDGACFQKRIQRRGMVSMVPIWPPTGPNLVIRVPGTNLRDSWVRTMPGQQLMQAQLQNITPPVANATMVRDEGVSGNVALTPKV